MNILNLLKDDHIRLSSELVKLRKNLNHPDIRGRIKHFISDYEAHESVEEELLLPLLNDLKLCPCEVEALDKCHENHDDIWGLLDRLLEAVDSMRFPEFQMAFFHLVAVTEGHFGLEERILFPTIERYMSADALDKAGKTAEQRLSAYGAFEHSSRAA
ncbi:MAG: hypothetical protein A3A86_03570 [Elusimicrobia bacterium RIFCSPLOWO2_01_FULL_60_11]|nr:MAG: hypothetical protein A3A86_03570 [Elusimicrobia bacterium RIFCSPLOWO2_01_FULL_60_11]